MKSQYFFNGAFTLIEMFARVSSRGSSVRHKSDVNLKWMVVSTKSARHTKVVTVFRENNNPQPNIWREATWIRYGVDRQL